ncbi:general negative regulator of transcription subunit 5 [Tulasnella sp. 403]|nr:general negative regulator of transcription subunit 5 [Tulasnella sp. 403]
MAARKTGLALAGCSHYPTPSPRTRTPSHPAEIDRTLKKVSEGVESFESIYEKMQSLTNQTQKEKLETDLKTQIKKLQRLREQIKIWVAGNDIKDKSALMENRRLIETQMEKFKACEKEMKTKAFSKEGLIAAQKLDPKEREKAEVSEWISSVLGELGRQVEQTEAEIAGIQATTKRKKGPNANGERLEKLKQANTRRNWHIGRLEIVLRLVNNGSLTPDTANGLKDDVNYFVESNQEEDFEPNEWVYDDLDLDEQEEAFRTVVEDVNHSDDAQSLLSDLPSRTGKEKAKPSAHDEVPLSPVQKKQTAPARRQSDKPEPPKPPVATANFAAQPMASALKAGLPQTNAPVKPVLPLRYAAAAGGAANPQPPPSATSTTVATPITSISTTAPPIPLPAAPQSSIPPPTPASTAPSLPPPAKTASVSASHSSPPRSPSAASMSISASSPIASSIAPPSQAVDSGSVAESLQNSRVQSPVISTDAVSPLVQSMSATTISATTDGKSVQSEAIQPVNGTSKASATQQTSAPSVPPGMQPPNTRTNTQSALPVPQQGPPPSLNPSPLPQQVQHFSATSTASTTGARQLDLVSPATQPSASYAPPGILSDTTQQSQTQRAASVQASQSQASQQARPNVPGSLGDLVSSFEAVKQKAAQRMANPDQMHKLLEVAMNGTPQPSDTEKPKYYVPRNQYNTPPYYPQQPLSILSTPQLFSQLDVETLFYVFYFLPGTYQQYLAAQQLKNQSWRFHVKYLTWFQRHSEPQAITEEYEQGVYVYFDWEGSWCQRKKSDFRFEYRYLSED